MSPSNPARPEEGRRPVSKDAPEPCEVLAAFAPVPRLKDRSNGWKPEVQRAFIRALAETGSVRAACRRVHRSEHGAYALRNHPEAAEFAAAWRAAQELGLQRLEDVAMERALHGTEVPVYSYGKIVGTRTVHNDRLVMFMLRNRAGERFAEGGRRGIPEGPALDRLKARWRKEWEAEREAKATPPAEVAASIERQIAALRQRVIARTSPRAFEHQLALQAQTRADEAAGWRPGLPYAAFADKAAELLPQFVEQARAEYPPHPEVNWCDADRRAMNAPPLLPAPQRDDGKPEPRVRKL